MTALFASERRGIGELLLTVAGTVAAVPVVLGFVALGGVVLASRAFPTSRARYDRHAMVGVGRGGRLVGSPDRLAMP